MPPFFFFLSGEHETLPFAELEAILGTERIAYKKLQKLPQLFRLDTTVDSIQIIKERAALTRVCCQELVYSEAYLSEIVKATQSTSLEESIQRGESFVVRVRRVGNAARNLTSIGLERKLGELILSKVKGAKVDLKKPQKTFFGVITDKSFLLGLKLAEIFPTPFMQRRPRRRPFFHPSAMPAKLARCMVNLAKPQKNDLFLDPFCGTGSFLIEAGLLGCKVLGSDAKRHMVKGSLRNLKFFGLKCEGLLVADAKHLPLKEVDCITTDPPYGRSASTMGCTTKDIIQEFLAVAIDKILRRKCICTAAPKTVHVGQIAEKIGFKHVQSHFVYVHRNLTREIVVLERA